MKVLQSLSFPLILLAIALVIGGIFSSLETQRSSNGVHSSKEAAIAASFK